MEKVTFDPWAWGVHTNSVQAVEVKQVQGTLYCSGQAAIDANGMPSAADMRTQLQQTQLHSTKKGAKSPSCFLHSPRVLSHNSCFKLHRQRCIQTFHLNH